MNKKISNEQWIAFRNKYRAYALVFLFFISFLSLAIYWLSGRLGIEFFYIFIIPSLVFGGHIYAFLYDKSYTIGAYPPDGSIGRVIFAIIFLATYIFFQFLPLII